MLLLPHPMIHIVGGTAGAVVPYGALSPRPRGNTATEICAKEGMHAIPIKNSCEKREGRGLLVGGRTEAIICKCAALEHKAHKKELISYILLATRLHRGDHRLYDSKAAHVRTAERAFPTKLRPNFTPSKDFFFLDHSS